MRSKGFLILPDCLGAMWGDVQRPEPWRAIAAATRPADASGSSFNAAAPWLFEPELPAALPLNTSIPQVAL